MNGYWKAEEAGIWCSWAMVTGIEAQAQEKEFILIPEFTTGRGNCVQEKPFLKWCP